MEGKNYAPWPALPRPCGPAVSLIRRAYFTSSVASPSSNAMLATLVAVVRKIEEASTGSAPSFLSTSGITAPIMA